MPRKKKQPIKRQRQSSYERARSQAIARLEKAVIERDKCAERLRALTIEIPRLEDMIAGIERFMGMTKVENAPWVSLEASKYTVGVDPANGRDRSVTATIEHGANGVDRVVDLTVDELPDEEDALLPDATGKVILP